MIRTIDKSALIGGAFIVAACIVWCVTGNAPQAYAADGGSLQAVTVAAAEESAASSADSLAAGEQPEAHADGWELDGKAWHYWKDGEMVTGAWVVTETAPAIKGAPAGSRRYWIDQDGVLARKRLIDPLSNKDDGADYWAYATKYGCVATGKTVVGDKVYLANKKGKLENGGAHGILVTKKYDGGERHRYLIDRKAHAVVTGKVVKVKNWGKAYSFPKTGYLACGITRIDKTHVLLATEEGKLCQQKGWVVTGKYTNGDLQRYWLGRTTKNKRVYGARVGLFKVEGSKYFASSKTGYVFRNGYKKISGLYYNADDQGSLTRNDVVNRMVSEAQGYSSPSQYLIVVDTDDTKFIVFEGSQDNWNVKFIWDCSTGAPWTPTPSGVWQVGIKGYSFGHGYTCYYYTQFNGDYLIHTRIYQEGTHILQDAAMNTRVSQGCVRLYDEDAIWVYENVPQGTTVVTFE